MSHKLNENLIELLSNLESIKDAKPMIVFLLEPYNTEANKKLGEFLDNHGEKIIDEDGEEAFSIKPENVRVFEQLSKISRISESALTLVPESLFVSLISQYDAFLNQLLRILFELRPEYINNSERELTFSQLMKFNSLEEAKEYVIEKEVESVLRKSHTEHFEYLESKLKITLRKDLPIWQTFIEITERRNLFVHCDGRVSNQYLKVCKDQNCKIGEVKLNQRLEIDPEYFKKAYECIFELSTKLTHTIWRKLIKQDLEDADRKLNNLCYQLLVDKQFNLADILLDFAYKQPKHFNDLTRNLFTVNKALSLYLQNRKTEAATSINTKDWSASSDAFRLAHLVITEDFDSAYLLMKKIGKSGDVKMVEYRTWPLFNNIRKEQKFKEIYLEIFGEEYTVMEIPKRPVHELFEEIVTKNPELLNDSEDEEITKTRKKRQPKIKS